MRKDTYNCYFIGDKSNPCVLLIHGMGFYWKKCFGEIIEELQKRYYVIIPELPGHHNEVDKKVRISVADIVTDIEMSIKKQNIDIIDAVYGISFGATIATELCVRNSVKVKTLILDGAQFVYMGWKSRMSAFVMALQFKRILSNKHMNSYVKRQLGYEGKDEIKILSEMMCNKISLKTLYLSAYECYTYKILDKENLACPVVFIYGEYEGFAAQSKDILSKKVNEQFVSKEFSGMGHAEILREHPDRINEIIFELES